MNLLYICKQVDEITDKQTDGAPSGPFKPGA